MTETTPKLRITNALKQARKKVETGWCQHQAKKRGAVCMTRACYEAAKTIPMYTALLDALWAQISSAPRVRGSVSNFNDVQGRTQSDVLAIFDKAIEASA